MVASISGKSNQANYGIKSNKSTDFSSFAKSIPSNKNIISSINNNKSIVISKNPSKMNTGKIKPSSVVKDTALATADREISVSQGLPIGRYDFSKMSANQFVTFVDNKIVNEKMNSSDNIGLIIQSRMNNYNTLSKTPYNILSTMKEKANPERSIGNINTAKNLEFALKYLENIQSSR